MSNNKYKVSLFLDKKRWDSFIDSSPQGNIFVTSNFIESLLDKYYLWTVSKDNEILCGAIIIKNGNKLNVGQYPYTMYQGIMFSTHLLDLPFHKRIVTQSELVKVLINRLTDKYRCVSLCIHHNFEDLREIQWHNYHSPELGQFQIGLRYTGIVELNKYKSFDDYLSQISVNRFYKYKKAKTELTLKETKDIEILDRLHNLTFKRQGIKRSTKEKKLLRSITSSALKFKYGRLYICTNKNNIPMSATLFLYYKQTAYYLFGANHPKYRQSNSGTFLMLENIRIALEEGYKFIDMCGINSPNRGDFKISLNAKPIAYYIATWKQPNN